MESSCSIPMIAPGAASRAIWGTSFLMNSMPSAPENTASWGSKYTPAQDQVSPGRMADWGHRVELATAEKGGIHSVGAHQARVVRY